MMMIMTDAAHGRWRLSVSLAKTLLVLGMFRAHSVKSRMGILGCPSLSLSHSAVINSRIKPSSFPYKTQLYLSSPQERIVSHRTSLPDGYS